MDSFPDDYAKSVEAVADERGYLHRDEDELSVAAKGEETLAMICGMISKPYVYQHLL